MAFACVFGIGITIGLRYSLHALLPAILGVICVYVVIDGPMTDRVFAIILCTIGLQGGYMVGLTGRGLAKNLVSRFSAPFRST